MNQFFWKCYGKDPESNNGCFVIIVRASSMEIAADTARGLLRSSLRSRLIKDMQIQLIYQDDPKLDGVVVYDDVEEG